MLTGRRSFLKAACVAGSTFHSDRSLKPDRSGNASQPIDIGDRKQLFIDSRFIAFQKATTLRLNPPQLQRENLLTAEHPWESARANHYSNLIYDQRFRLWYSAHASLTDFSKWAPGAKRFDAGRTCYAESEDGIHFVKPSLGIVNVNGSSQNNIVVPGVSHCVFRDPFDRPERRYKMLVKAINGFDRTVISEWPAAKGMSPGFSYLSFSPDGLRWNRSSRPFFPMSIGSQRTVFWDDRLSKWIVYLRGHRPQNSFYSRIEIESGGWESPVSFRRLPGKKYHDIPLEYDDQQVAQDPFPGGVTLNEELPVALDIDSEDAPHANVYSMNGWKYPDAEDVYLAFVPMWYFPDAFGKSGQAFNGSSWRSGRELASDGVEVQLAISRDGVRYYRPWKMPLIPPDVLGSEAGGQIWPVPDPVVRGSEIWLYYQAVPYVHRDFVAPKPGRGITARAIFRLDGFVSVDCDTKGGEIVTPPLRFKGNQLQINVNAGAGGRIRIAIEEADGTGITGHTLEDSDPTRGNQIAAVASWRGRTEVGRLRSRAVRLRFAMDYSRLYAFQFRSVLS